MSRIDPVFREIDLLIAEIQSPEARSARFVEMAAEHIAEVRATNAAIAGRDVPPEIIVDGKKGAPLASVRPDGVIVANFDLVTEALEWIGEQLVLASPILTGRYQRSHILKADGVEVPLNGTIPAAASYEFVNIQPYARKIEPKSYTIRRRDRSGPIGTRRRWSSTTRSGDGQSQQAPDGVYAAVAAMASKRFGNIARIQYKTHGWDNYDPATGYVHPSIEVRVF